MLFVNKIKLFVNTFPNMVSNIIDLMLGNEYKIINPFVGYLSLEKGFCYLVKRKA